MDIGPLGVVGVGRRVVVEADVPRETIRDDRMVVESLVRPALECGATGRAVRDSEDGGGTQS